MHMVVLVYLVTLYRPTSLLSLSAYLFRTNEVDQIRISCKKAGFYKGKTVENPSSETEKFFIVKLFLWRFVVFNT